LNGGQKPIDEVVGVIPVGVEGVADPQPPNQEEKTKIGEDACPIANRQQATPEDGDGDDESEVVEEFQPSGGPLGLSLDGSKLRWAKTLHNVFVLRLSGAG
jgi:hypothetical protein